MGWKLAIYIFTLISISSILLVESSRTIYGKAVHFSSFFGSITAYEMAVQLTLCCNQTLLYGELNIKKPNAIQRWGQDLHYHCYNEEHNTVLDGPLTIIMDFYAQPLNLNAIRGCEVVYEYVDTNDTSRSVSITCVLPQDSTTGSTTDSTTIYETISSLPSTTTRDTTEENVQLLLPVETMSVVIATVFLCFISITVAAIFVLFRRYNCYRLHNLQVRHSTLQGFYTEENPWDLEPSEIVGKMTITLSIDTLVLPFGQYSLDEEKGKSSTVNKSSDEGVDVRSITNQEAVISSADRLQHEYDTVDIDDSGVVCSP